MEILPYTMKWLELVLRWGHVLFAILWVGNSFLFNYLDNKLNKKISSRDVDGEGKAADDNGDEGTIDLLGAYIGELEKTSWMLDAWRMKTNDTHPTA